MVYASSVQEFSESRTGSYYGGALWECGGSGRHASPRNWFERVRVQVPPFLLKILERKGERTMTQFEKLALMKNRLATLEENGKNNANICKKIRRQIRQLENER